MNVPSHSDLSSSIENLISKLSNPLPPVSQSDSSSSSKFPTHLASIIDHTLLAPTATKNDVVNLCKEAIQLGTATACVNSSMVSTAAETLKGSSVGVCSVVSFPFGAMESQSKAEEARKAVQDGATEIDMVINLGLIISSDWTSLYKDVSLVVEASSSVPVKVILESSLLNRNQLISASYISCLAGAKFLKTSTGYALPPSEGWGNSNSNDKKPSSGAQRDDVRLMFEIAKSRNWNHGYEVEIKASGGIRSLKVVREMWENGATRVGASGSKKILEELEMEKNGGQIIEKDGNKGDGY